MIDKETIANLSRLTRIHCTEEEKKDLEINLKKIIKHADQLKEVDTDGVEPCNNVLFGVTCPLREDESKNSLSNEKFLKNSPDHVGGMIRVPPVKRS
jgi:aspartyl-tRNA(Asn)/glutamyl-tRNA(Gln) amidotransferase subunit C